MKILWYLMMITVKNKVNLILIIKIIKKKLIIIKRNNHIIIKIEKNMKMILYNKEVALL